MSQKKPRYYRWFGPGIITGAADDDPSGIATYSQAGAQFGFGLLWTVFLTTPFMIAIQLVSAEIGRVTGRGVAANIGVIFSRRLMLWLLSLLLVANTINIAADLVAMGEALSLVIGGIAREHALVFAAISVLLQVFIPYRKYAPILKFLTLSLLLYVVTAFSIEIDWHQVLTDTFFPRVFFSPDVMFMIIALLGTTISPYLFFWQASQEVEELNLNSKGVSTTVPRAEFRRMTADTAMGMIFSNLVAYFIILTTAATLHASNVTEIRTAADAASALRPLAGDLAFACFALGIIGTGLLAIPVLAGSAAYAVSEALGWPATLEARPGAAKGFYMIIAIATIFGFLLGLLPVDPIRLLVWSALLNGIVAIPIMAAMTIVASSSKVMGRFRVGALLRWSCWALIIFMAIAVIALVVLS